MQNLNQYLTAAQQIQLAIAETRTDDVWLAESLPEVALLRAGMRRAKSANDVYELSSRIATGAGTAWKKSLTPSETIELAGLVRKGLQMTDSELTRAEAIKAAAEGRAITKAAVSAATTANTPALYYSSQQSGVTPLVPVVTRSLISMLSALGALPLPPNVRALVQPNLLQAAEITEGVPYPAAAPSTDVRLQSNRKFGFIAGFNNELVNLGTDAIVGFVQSTLEQGANNATDAAMVESITSAAGAAESTVNAAIRAFAGDIRTAAWIGNPETLATLRSAQETNVGPQGGTYYQLPALPVLAMPNGSLALIDVKRVAVFDGPQFIERTNEADVAFDTSPTSATQVQHLFQQNMSALKITKYADYSLLVNPVMVAV
ncbi:hypothetical protein M3I54_29450 [Paraburkholderia sp. CNPSo 3274]|uniref:hypothetical protein n=1 Tax=Paraburkholderia sp. CNPSo 3274 TaxID=2940932 RepID=UPI0020B7432A|nr:hypothetical protein [Paraburkholderia sp. CNPSo 3274]MCP3711055.1 hypothetical protein [Paraburkholderia sp. CNPSo 3274]